MAEQTLVATCGFWSCGEPTPCPFHEQRHEQVVTDEETWFVCPACGGSFRVKDERSQRIFCLQFCRGYGRTL